MTLPGQSDTGADAVAEGSRVTRLTMAYADPPYPGQSKRLYGHHKDYAGEVDHQDLIDRMEREYPDGWALSTGAKNLPAVLRLCPDTVRVLIWRKPGVPFGDNFLWCYEPVILRASRYPLGRVADVCEAVPPGQLMTFRARGEKHVTGAKPEAFCHWLFRCMGLGPNDHLDDLFPGSGAVAAAWRTFTTQGQLVA